MLTKEDASRDTGFPDYDPVGMHDQATAREAFKRALVSFADHLDHIDRETPWSVREPMWWLNMVNTARLARALATDDHVDSNGLGITEVIHAIERT